MTKKKPTRPRGLTSRQALFIAEYLKCLNATEAARKAGYSAKTAMWQGPQLLQKPHVAAAIEEQQRARLERLELDADGLTRLWSTVATRRTIVALIRAGAFDALDDHRARLWRRSASPSKPPSRPSATPCR